MDVPSHILEQAPSEEPDNPVHDGAVARDLQDAPGFLADTLSKGDSAECFVNRYFLKDFAIFVKGSNLDPFFPLGIINLGIDTHHIGDISTVHEADLPLQDAWILVDKPGREIDEIIGSYRRVLFRWCWTRRYDGTTGGQRRTVVVLVLSALSLEIVSDGLGVGFK